MKILNFTFALLFAIALFSCKSNDASKTGSSDSTQTSSTDASSSKAPDGAKYKLKSAVVTFTSEIMGMKQNITQYFDDYGKKEAVYVDATMDLGIGEPMKINSAAINVDGYTYNIDLIKKTGSKVKQSGGGNPSNIDFSKMSEKMMKDMNIKKEGTETVMGKTCDVYSMDSKGMKGSFCVWNNISLKTTMKAMGMDTKMEATKLEENVSIPAAKFEVPSDVKISDM